MIESPWFDPICDTLRTLLDACWTFGERNLDVPWPFFDTVLGHCLDPVCSLFYDFVVIV